MKYLVCALTMALGWAPHAGAMSDQALADIVRQRLAGDRTQACFAVAVIDGGVSRAVECAGKRRAWDADTAFEIGSVSKTMNGALLALLIEQGKLRLDAPLSDYLPEGTKVPSAGGVAITLQHLVTHTAGLPGLPPNFVPARADNPYATLRPDDLLAGLAATRLTATPGTQWDYSNFGAMLLSWVLTRVAESSYEQLLQGSLLQPLGMRHSYIDQAPDGVSVAQGHLQTGASTSAWDLPDALAGVGGVRASLNDMVRYAQAQLQPGDDALGRALKRSQQPLSAIGKPMAMGWLLAPLDRRQLLVHEGGTGGFSSFVAVDRERGRAVVILSDTAMTALGGLGSLGLHLVDARLPLGQPRTAAQPDPALLASLVGRYRLEGGLALELRVRDGQLELQAEGQAPVQMGYDSAGDFYPLHLDALLRPQRGAGGMRFVWSQGGAEQWATRVDAQAVVQAPAGGNLAQYLGEYPLAPTFVMTVSEQAGRLYVQATGQQALPLDPVSDDLYAIPRVGAELRFERDAAGVVVALVLIQGGHEQRAPRRS
ncbi:MAG: serine hydrolase [Lysobacterales bacterium]